MLRLGILTARGRLAAFTGAFVALMAAAVLTMAWGMQLEAVLRGDAPVERYADAAAVVTGQQTVGADHDVLLTERARVDSDLTARLATVPGVKAAIGDVSVPVHLGNRDAAAHGWASAALTPYVLRPVARRPDRARSSPAIPPRSAHGCSSRPRSRPAGSRWSASLARGSAVRSRRRSS